MNKDKEIKPLDQRHQDAGDFILKDDGSIIIKDLALFAALQEEEREQIHASSKKRDSKKDLSDTKSS